MVAAMDIQLSTSDFPRRKKRRAAAGKYSSIPEDILLDILCRLSALDVLNCQSVCKRWNYLLSTQSFRVMHKQHVHAPMIFVQEFRHTQKGFQRQIESFLLHSWSDPSCKRTVKYKFGISSFQRPFRLLFSYDGLVLLRKEEFTKFPEGPERFILFNPLMSKKKVEIIFPRKLYLCEAIGMFWHPTLKEYCLLCAIKQNHDDAKVKMMMIHLGERPFYRNIHCSINKLRLQRCIPHSSPLVIDGVLFRLSMCVFKEAIMAFDIKNEQFTLVPLPVPPPEGISFSLLKYNDKLSVVDIILGQTTFDVNIWILGDMETRVWTHVSYTITPPVGLYAKMVGSLTPYLVVVTPYVIVGSKLLIASAEVGGLVNLLVCDFKLGTLRRLRTLCWYDAFVALEPNFVPWSDSTLTIPLED